MFDTAKALLDDGQYIGLEFSSLSGHFYEAGNPFWAPGGGAEQLGKDMFEAAGVNFG